jgi:hypothetical protein
MGAHHVAGLRDPALHAPELEQRGLGTKAHVSRKAGVARNGGAAYGGAAYGGGDTTPDPAPSTVMGEESPQQRILAPPSAQWGR